MKISCKHQKLIEKRIPFYNDFTGDESIDVSWEWEDTFKDIESGELPIVQLITICPFPPVAVKALNVGSAVADNPASSSIPNGAASSPNEIDAAFKSMVSVVPSPNSVFSIDIDIGNPADGNAII